MDLDLTRWVIVTSNHGEKYVGKIPDGVPNGAAYFEGCVEEKRPVQLTEARLMLAQYGMSNQDGGIQTMVAFVPIDLSDGPMEEINVMPSSWYFPPTAPSVIEKFKRLLKAADEAEGMNRARQAGIHLPGVRR